MNENENLKEARHLCFIAATRVMGKLTVLKKELHQFGYTIDVNLKFSDDKETDFSNFNLVQIKPVDEK